MSSSPKPPHPQSSAALASAGDRALRDRFHGALLGLAACDALAAAKQGQGPGVWTDDTSMALCLAESLLEREGFDVRDQVERYTSWQSQGYLSATGEAVGITANTARALAAAQWRRQVFAGSHDPKQLDPEVLSRVAPAVMFGFAVPEEALRLACDAARTTCQAPIALDACQLFAAFLVQAFRGEAKAQIVQPGPELLDATALRPKVSALLQRPAAAVNDKAPRVSGTVIDVLVAALWAFETTGNFQDGALLAAGFGERADVIAAAYGQLAGAHYGAQAIPAAWRSALVEGDLIMAFAERLFTHARARMIE